MKNKRVLLSPSGGDMIVVGVTLNADTCHRIVDRGPPADDLDATKSFLELWGEKKAELRRFKDGAIVHAVVWGSTPTEEEQREEDDDLNAGRSPFIRFQNDDKVQGGIVERAIRHILRLHFLKKTTPTAKRPSIKFSLRSMMSAVDSVTPRGEGVLTFNPLAAHRMVLKAFDSLSDFLRKQSLPSVPIPGSTKLRSPLGIPLAIDAVEPLAPSLRYCELFPPMPHPSLGGATLGKATGKNRKLSVAILSDPILIQIRFGASSKWPNDLKAIGAAKTAMLVQLVSGIEQLRKTKRGYSDSDLIHAFDGPTVVSPGYADIGFMGYVFRILVRADPELKLLHSLTKPSPEAASLLRALSRRHVVAAMHHSMVHAVYTSHPSSSAVVRLARRWVASHLLSGMIPFEAVELLVVHIYSDRASPLDPPGTVMVGFLRFLQLLAGHNWSREPLIVDPQGHLTEDDYNAISTDFEALREKTSAPSMARAKTNTSTARHGPPMFIVSPCDRQPGGSDKRNDVNKNSLWMPTFTLETPEWVVLNRAAKLAQRSFVLLRRCLMSHPFCSSASSSASLSAPHNHPLWPCVFQETMESFRAYSAIFRVHPDFLVDDESSSSTRNATGTIDTNLVARRNTDGAWESSYTRSMDQRLSGPKDLRLKNLYKNLADTHHDGDDENQRCNNSPLLLEWRPVDSMVENLRRRLGHTALFFYNDLCPEVVGVLWRPQLFVSKSFSAITSECVRPLVFAAMQPTTKGKDENETSLVVVHALDLLREASAYTADIVMDQKVFYPPMLSSSDTETPETRKKQVVSAAKSSLATGRKRQLPTKDDDDNEDE
jgi:U3 small nucleolar RNA-associated protein 22